MNSKSRSQKAYRLKCKSMPLWLKPGVTAEDDDVSAWRTYRFLKLDDSSEQDLPGPCKFARKPQQSRLTRSKSTYDCSALIESSSSTVCCFGLNSPVYDRSSLAHLLASLRIDDFQNFRPPSLPETLMSNSSHNEVHDAVLESNMLPTKAEHNMIFANNADATTRGSG
jgi:hypothetical protein